MIESMNKSIESINRNRPNQNKPSLNGDFGLPQSDFVTQKNL